MELARGLLREIDAAAEKFDAVIRGRTGSYRITASSMWMEAVLAPAVDAFSARLPGIELTLRTAPRRPRRGRLPPRGPARPQVEPGGLQVRRRLDADRTGTGLEDRLRGGQDGMPRHTAG